MQPRNTNAANPQRQRTRVKKKKKERKKEETDKMSHSHKFWKGGQFVISFDERLSVSFTVFCRVIRLH